MALDANLGREKVNRQSRVRGRTLTVVLILDDIAYVTKAQEETSGLFELTAARYEHRSPASPAGKARASVRQRSKVPTPMPTRCANASIEALSGGNVTTHRVGIRATVC